MAAEKDEFGRLFCAFYCLFNLFIQCGSATNLALRKNVEANVTCGTPAELYYKTWQGMHNSWRFLF